MNSYSALDLLQKLNIDTLEFKDFYNELKLPTDILIDYKGDLYYCKDKEEYENICQDYSWHITGIFYFYDKEVSAVVIEYKSEDTDPESWDTVDQLFAIVPKSFLEAYKIKLEV